MNKYHFETIKLRRLCPICSFDEAESLYNIKYAKDKKEKIPNSSIIAACLNCGFIFDDTDFTQKEYNEHYSQCFTYSTNAAGSGGTSSSDIIRYDKQIERIGKFIKNKNSHIIDVGCAKGGLLRRFKEMGYKNLYGVDPGSSFLDILKVNGINATVGNALSLNELDMTFDVLILSHVIEHIYDLHTLIFSIKSVLKEGSIAYIEAPYAGGYLNYSYRPYYYFNFEHINHFSKNTLKMCFHNFDPLLLGTDTFTMPNNKKYPIVYGIFKNINSSLKSIIEYKKDETTVNKMKEFVIESQQIDEYNIKDIDVSLPCFLYGLGPYLRRLLLDKRYFKDLNIVGIIDRDISFKGMKINMHNGNEIPVFTPSNDLDKLFDIFKGYEKVNVIITAAVWAEKIKEDILKNVNFSGNIHII